MKSASDVQPDKKYQLTFVSMLGASCLAAFLFVWAVGVTGVFLWTVPPLIGLAIHTKLMDVICRIYFPEHIPKGEVELSISEAREEAYWWLAQPDLFECTDAGLDEPVFRSEIPESVQELFRRYSTIRSLDRYRKVISINSIADSRFLEDFVRIGTYSDNAVEVVVHIETGKVTDLTEKLQYEDIGDLVRWADESIFHYIALSCRLDYPGRLKQRDVADGVA